MEISYDKDADAVYIRFVKGSFARNRKIDDLTILDLDKEGRLLGIEILEASKRIPRQSLAELHVKNIQVAA
jgi:uncharacterized protein YuzE